MAFLYGTVVSLGAARREQFFLSLLLLLCIFPKSLLAHPQLHRHQRGSASALNAVRLGTTSESDELEVCYNSDISYVVLPYDGV